MNALALVGSLTLALATCSGADAPQRPLDTDAPLLPGIELEKDATCSWQIHDPCARGLYCRTFQDAPTTEDARCVPGDANPTSRILGTVWSLDGWIQGLGAVAVPGATVSLVRGLELATGAGNARVSALESGPSDEHGRYDFTIDATGTPLGILALVSHHDHFPTATGVSSPLDPQPPDCPTPCYGAGADAHDVFTVRTETLDTWSTALKSDERYVTDRLPLGQRGGALGIVRNVKTNEAVPGVKMVSSSGGKARVRYLDEDGVGFNRGATTSTGVFVIVGPSIAEGFVAQLAGRPLVPRPNFAGSTPNVVLVMVMNVQPGALTVQPD